MEDIVVLGASGNLGTICLKQLIELKRYRLVGISFAYRFEEIEPYLSFFPKLELIGIKDIDAASRFVSLHPEYKEKVIVGDECSVSVVEAFSKATVFNSISGNDGLKPTIAAIRGNHDLLLCNKESVVNGYSLIEELLPDYKGRLIPVDSEHAALYEIMKRVDDKTNLDFFITASGGALRDMTREEMKSVQPSQVLKHPTWNMSEKITVDCATLVNKGYEIIEARCLFSLKKVDAYIYRSSLIHAGAFSKDKSKKEAFYEYYPCTMAVPIKYALLKTAWRMDEDYDLDSERLNELEEIDETRFPLFGLTQRMFDKYSHIGMMFYNAVDTKAVSSFLKKEISYLEIEQALLYTYRHLDSLPMLSEENLDVCLKKSEEYASALLLKKPWRSK